jgi:circadian clock protein KaiB
MPEIARKSATPKEKKFVLKLYVTGATRISQRAIQNLKQICEEYLSGGYDLEVVDVYKTPEMARAAEILASPTLVKEVPAPVRRLIGDLSQRDRVLLLLGLKGK